MKKRTFEPLAKKGNDSGTSWISRLGDSETAIENPLGIHSMGFEENIFRNLSESIHFGVFGRFYKGART